MRKFLIRATFEQAKEDGVTVLEIGEDVWGLNEFLIMILMSWLMLLQVLKRNRSRYRIKAPNWIIKTLSNQLFRRLFIAFWGNKNFYSIDLYGDELAQPIENFRGIYRRAKKKD